MPHPIRQIGDPLLHRITTPIDFKHPQSLIAHHIQLMAHQLTEQGGVGIASNQVTAIKQPLRMMIAGVLPSKAESAAKTRYSDRVVPEAEVMLNPEILEVAGSKYYPGESCLSVCGHLRARVARYPQVYIRYHDINGIQHQNWVSDFKAHIVQHECDHLNGLVYLERLFGDCSPELRQDILFEIKREINQPNRTESLSSREIIFCFERNTDEQVVINQNQLLQSLTTTPTATLKGILRLLEGPAL